MKKYRLKQCDMNVDELKIKALLEGLEAQKIEEIMREAKVGDYRNYGKAYISAFRDKIEEEKPLFITDDGVKVFDRDTIVYNVRNNTLAKLAVNAVYLNKHDFEHKVFFHESHADEYILMNKRVFSYNDIEKYQSGGEGVCYDVKAIAKERIEE